MLKKALCGLGIVALGLGIWTGIFCARAWQSLDMEKLEATVLTTFLYDRKGEAISGVHGGENRVWTEAEDLPEHVVNAFLAAEDARFFRHGGIDPYRIAGALWANIRSGSISQGGSTITQQLIKLTHLSPEKTLGRKLREAVMALRLEREMDKNAILEAYLNRVYFGAGAYGIGTAAGVYFQKTPQELTLPEAALLAGILKSPSRYAPHLQPENAHTRRDLVLRAMYEAGFVDEEAYAHAVQQPVQLNMAPAGMENWYTDGALDEAARALGISRDQLLQGGYHIYTAMDLSMQQAAEDLFAQGDLFPSDAPDGEPVQAAMAAVDPQTGGILALVGGREYVARGFDRATQMRRQPGSAFKPVSVYAAAVDAFGYLPASPVQDVEKDYGKGYIPRNADGVYHGTVLLREALSASMNAAAVELISVTGTEAAAQYAQRLGLTLSPSDQGLSMALGALTEGVTPLEMAAAYGALGNGGYGVEPYMVARIEDRNGSIVYEARTRRERVLGEESAFLLTSMLKTAAQTGTARALAEAGVPVAAKTGTVGMEDGRNRDAWTVAYTPNVSVAVWMGFDQPDENHAMAASVSGGSYPARLAAQWLKVCPEAGGEDFPLPRSLVPVVLDKTALTHLKQPLLASQYTPEDQTVTEYFPAGRTPDRISTLWTPPQPVLDARFAGSDLLFTALSEEEEYVIFRDGTEAAVLRGVYGEQLRFEDPDPGSVYRIYARNAGLYEAGIQILSAGVEIENPAALPYLAAY